MTRYIVFYTCPNSPIKYKQKIFDKISDAKTWIDKFKVNFGNNWSIKIERTN